MSKKELLSKVDNVRLRMKIYITGCQVDESTVSISLSSSVVLFLLKYCKTRLFHVLLVDCQDLEQAVVEMSVECLQDLDYSFIDRQSIPKKVSNCVLPVIEDGKDLMIRCGLCTVVRRVIKLCHDLMSKQKENTLIDLLGFRAASLKACSEVSGWTKLCEVELPDNVYRLINRLRANSLPRSVEIPEDVMKLELHFDIPPLLHNDDKKKRLLLKAVQKELEDIGIHPEDEKMIVKKFFANRENTMPHGNISYRVITQEEKESKKFVNSDNGDKCKFGCTENRLIKWCAKCNDREKLRRKEERQVKNNSRLSEKSTDNGVTSIGQSELTESESLVKTGSLASNSIASIEELCGYVNNLTLYDIEYEHVYAEGVCFTVADIILFVYIYHLMESLKFRCSSFLQKLPNVKKWLSHILTLPRMQHTSLLCGFKTDVLINSVKEMTDEGCEPEFTIPVVTLNVEENTAEISRSSKAKQKALKQDISRVLEKIKEHKLNPIVGHHPYGDNVQVDWRSVPLSAHPKIELPEKRVGRKCEQLENLATAVQAIASPGDVIVDFCSGAGHLGIIIAYLLPDCQVYLIENKEESLVRASRRVAQLGLDNVTLYQVFLVENNEESLVRASRRAKSLNLTNISLYQDAIVLGHAADQTEENTDLQQQGRHCMNLVDTDRARLAIENGYSVTLCSLKPLSCTPKNNILIGTNCSSIS